MAKRRRSSETAVYVISVAAELAGVHPQTLRVYERKGLLAAGADDRATRAATPRRTSSGSGASRSSRSDEGVNLAGAKMVLRLEEQLDRMRRELESHGFARAGPRSRRRARDAPHGAAGRRDRPGPRIQVAAGALESSSAKGRKDAAAHRDGSHRDVTTDGSEQAHIQITRSARRPRSGWPTSATHQEIAPEHLLAALLGEAEGAVYPTLQKLGASPRVLRDSVGEAPRPDPEGLRAAAGRAARPGLRLGRRWRRSRSRGEGSRRAQGLLRLDRAPASRPRCRRRSSRRTPARSRRDAKTRS